MVLDLHHLVVEQHSHELLLSDLHQLHHQIRSVLQVVEAILFLEALLVDVLPVLLQYAQIVVWVEQVQEDADLGIGSDVEFGLGFPLTHEGIVDVLPKSVSVSLYEALVVVSQELHEGKKEIAVGEKLFGTGKVLLLVEVSNDVVAHGKGRFQVVGITLRPLFGVELLGYENEGLLELVIVLLELDILEVLQLTPEFGTHIFDQKNGVVELRLVPHGKHGVVVRHGSFGGELLHIGVGRVVKLGNIVLDLPDSRTLGRNAHLEGNDRRLGFVGLRGAKLDLGLVPEDIRVVLDDFFREQKLLLHSSRQGH